MSFFRRAGAAIARIFQSAADPAAEADKVLLYSKDAAGVSQLFARSDDGTVHQITPGGGGADPAVIFDDSVPAAERNIRSDRATAQSAINNTRVGITNFGSQIGTVKPLAPGATANYATISGGYDNEASGIASTVAGGYGNIASREAAHAEGLQCTASGDASHAEGILTTASDDGTHAEGLSTIASNNYAHAEGQSTLASGAASHAEGKSTQATATYAHAEGENTVASGGASHAEGISTTASQAHAHAEGNGTTASGANGAHSEGYLTTASGQAAHAEGISAVAAGNFSHAAGYQTATNAIATASHASGYRSVASRETQIAHSGGRIGVNGDAQVSVIDMYSPTANAPIAAGVLRFGDSPINALVLQDERAYAVRVLAVAGGGASGAVSACITRHFVFRATGGVATVIASGVQTVIGHATAVANWSITANAVGAQVQFLFDTGADAATANISVSARVEFAEVLTVITP